MIRKWINSRYEKSAGLITITWRGPINAYHLHFIVHKQHWSWGYEEDWWDGPLPSIGFGPIFLLAWMWFPKDKYP